MTLKAVYALAKKSKKRAINHYEAREMMKKSLVSLFLRVFVSPLICIFFPPSARTFTN